MTDQTPYVLAVIPARGGSKSVPRKNLLDILGKPLIAYSIDHAQRSTHVTRTIVSTDDEEIAAVARAYGAEAPFMRPAEFAGDRSTDYEVFRHCLEWIRDNEARMPDLVVHLRPTGPARRISLIDAAIERMLAHPEADALRSMNMSQQTPYKMWVFEECDHVRPAATLAGVPEAHSMARQSLPVAYWQNGYVDIVRPQTILEKGSMVGDSVLGFVIPHQVHDIDYKSDIADVERAVQRLIDGVEDDDSDDEGRVPV